MTSRLKHLDAVRGLACLQVLLLHGLGTFRPGLVDGPATSVERAIRTSPLRLLYDGDLAVFVFFVLSGLVLTAPFARDAARPATVLTARLLRFLVPALMAVALGAFTLLVLGPVAPAAGARIGSGWLLGGLPGPPALIALLRDATLNALAIGYEDLSPFTAILPLSPSATSTNPPLWTLSIEMQGALLLLILTLVRRHAPRLGRPALAMAAILCLRSPLLCFLVGHAIARSEIPRSARLAVALLAVPVAAIDPALLEPLPLLPGLEPDLIRAGWTAMLLSPLVLQSPWLAAALSRPSLQRLGALSFPLYLVHWPMLFGPGAAALLLAEPVVGLDIAAAIGLATGLAAAVLVALPFQAIDRWSQSTSRWLRAPARHGSFSTTLAR